MRKLKRKKTKLSNARRFKDKKSSVSSKKKEDFNASEYKVKKIKKYKKKRCSFVFEDGVRCKNRACKGDVLCKKHGGVSKVIKENLVPIDEEYILRVDSKYDPAYHPIRYIELSREGKSPVEIAAEFSISDHTIKNWNEKYESFNTAYEIGQAMYESWWLMTGKENLQTRGFNTHLYKFLTGNKLGYSDKIEQKSMNMNVHGVLMIPDKMNEDEWEKEGIIDDKSS